MDMELKGIMQVEAGVEKKLKKCTYSPEEGGKWQKEQGDASQPSEGLPLANRCEGCPACVILVWHRHMEEATLQTHRPQCKSSHSKHFHCVEWGGGDWRWTAWSKPSDGWTTGDTWPWSKSQSCYMEACFLPYKTRLVTMTTMDRGVD